MRRRPSSHPAAPLVGGAALAVLLALPACDRGGSAAPRAVRTDSAGVAIVVNDSVDRPLAWTFTPRFSLGGEESGPESFYGIARQSVDTDAQGNLYLLDGGNHRVLVFDSTGAFVREHGGEGGGPGELQFPGFVVVSPDGTPGVYDYSRRGVVRWSPAGEPLPLEPLARPDDPSPQLLRAVQGGQVALVDHRDAPEATTRRSVLEWQPAAPAEGERPPAVVLASRESPAPVMHMYRSCTPQVGLSLGPILEPTLVWTTAGGRVLVARDTAYAIAVLEGTRPVASIRRRTAARPATREMAVAELGEGLKVRFGNNECTLDPDEVIEARGVAAVLQPVGAITVAPDGGIWVTRGAVRGEPRIVDVFDATGEYLGTLPEGAPDPVAFLANGDLVAIEKDELDVEHLVVYRVQRAADAP